MPRPRGEAQPPVKIDTLEPSEQEQIERLESKTDTIMGLRMQLAAFYAENKAYLPKAEEGKRGRMTLADLLRVRTDGGDPFAQLDYRAIEKKVAKFEGKDRVRAAHVLKAKVKAAFSRALTTYETLVAEGGELKGKFEAKSTIEKEVAEYYRMRWREQAEVMRELANLEREVDEVEEAIEFLKGDPDVAGDPDTFAALEAEYETKHKALRELIMESPEAYFAVYGRRLEEWKQTLDEGGRMVEVPYVKAKIARALQDLRAGKPLFIHGELGSGKTEFAYHIARTRLSEPHLSRWKEQNPPPEDTNSDAYAAWLAACSAQREPEVVSGHRNIEADQIIASRGIERREPVAPERLADMVRERWTAYRDASIATYDGEDREEFARRLDDERGGFERAMHETYRNPVTTRVMLGPFLKAMRDGKPVIIDEMNAIPHHVLIAINDLLMRRPGEVVHPPYPDAEPFTVKEGFCVMATGNYKPEDGKMYVGRQKIDAALLSRFGVLSYDYLPNERELEPAGMPEEELRARREENQAFWMYGAHLYAKGDHGEVRMPRHSLEQLRKLAFVARLLQDVFSEREVDSAMYANVNGAKVAPKDVLQENVLSIRHIIPLLDVWAREGFSRPLDEYLFLHYVSRSDARPAEKQYLYDKLQVVGDFFPVSEGWPDAGDTKEFLAFRMEERFFARDGTTGKRAPRAAREGVTLKTFTKKDFLVAMFGPPPKRRVLRAGAVARLREAGKEVLVDEEAKERAAAWMRMFGGENGISARAGRINELDEDKEYPV